MSDITSLKAIEAAKAGQTTAAAAPKAATTAAASRAAGGELDPGKSTVKGSVDYFNGKSVITDADTVIDIATIMHENKASNMSPEKMAAKLREKGYEVQLVKIGNRKAVQFKNGDFFVDSDGDGNLGTKDQNFQEALGMVEQRFGVNLHALKTSKYTAYHKYSEIGKGKDATGKITALDGTESAAAANELGLFNIMNRFAQEKQAAEARGLDNVFAKLDVEMAARGFNGGPAVDLWHEGRLSQVLADLGIPEPNLPDASSAVNMQKSLNLFGAAMGVATNRQAAML
jgi:hypothetical protein